MQLGTQQQILAANLRAAKKKPLIDANHMRSVKLQTLQAFTIYLVLVMHTYYELGRMADSGSRSVETRCQGNIAYLSACSSVGRNELANIAVKAISSAAQRRPRCEDYCSTRSVSSTYEQRNLRIFGQQHGRMRPEPHLLGMSTTRIFVMLLDGHSILAGPESLSL